MTEREQRKNELLTELGKRFQTNAEAMRKIAGRLEQAAAKSRDLDRQLQGLSEPLQQCVAGKRGDFSYREYLEFSRAAEFAKFRDMPAITAEELRAADFDQIGAELQKG
ncbi:hypothetical protein FACS1894139_17460 [Planctomycetales bacterium]|nr:hypothetical protein FACS1894108_12970 [Planctomycetales bacterium]GHT08145.1 hypothetical protein FACS1894139_17460 [Planctomycetales bacterium]GHV23412.1 hypothetical protein AGMMS49959_16360 [Planctomycetales bacterium]